MIKITPMSQRHIQILYFKAGGGHISAMHALTESIAKFHPDWSVSSIDIYTILAPLDPISNFTQDASESKAVTKIINKISHKFPAFKDLQFKHFTIEELYNFILKEDLIIGLGVLLPLLQAYIKSRSKQIQALFRDHFRDGQKPDMVISVIPNYNLEMGTALKAVYPETPYVTLITDLVNLDTQFDFWMAKLDQHIICGTPEAYVQAIKSDYYAFEKIHRTSGMILRQSFYDKPDHTITHADIGLDPALPTLAVMFGGNGSTVSCDIVKAINKAKLRLQTIVFCGNNEKVFRELTELRQSGQLSGCYPISFTDKVPQLLQLSQFFIGKPGPGGISEAVQMGCVVITAKKRVMPQEAFNLEFIDKKGLGIVIDSFKERHVIPALQSLLDDYNGAQIYPKRVAAFPRNNAAAEIMDTLENILESNPVAATEANQANNSSTAA